MSAAEVQILNFGLKMGRLRDALMVDTVSRCGCLREREESGSFLVCLEESYH